MSRRGPALARAARSRTAMTLPSPAAGSAPGHAPRPPGDAPVFLTELAGPDLVVVSATRGAAMALAGRDTSLVGCRAADVVQGPGAQRLIETLQEVRTTGRHARNVLWQARDAGGTEEAGRAAFSVSAVPVRRAGLAGGVVIAGLRLTSLPARMPGPGRTAGAAPAPGLPRFGCSPGRRGAAGTAGAAGGTPGRPVRPRARGAGGKRWLAGCGHAAPRSDRLDGGARRPPPGAARYGRAAAHGAAGHAAGRRRAR